MKTIKSLTEAEIAELPNLPVEWKWVKLGEHSFVTKLAGFEFTKYVKYKERAEIPVIRAQNVSKTGFIPTNFVYVDRETMEKLPRSRIHGGEILMVFVGSVGNVSIAPSNKEYFLGPNVAKIDLEEHFNNKYVLFFLSSVLGFGNVSGMVKATTQSSISMSNIREVAIPFVALEEQRAIVSKIEQLFSELDNGISNLKLAQEQLKVYRQAVLKKAFEGELTKKWREQQTNLPDAGELLEQIGKERDESSKTSGKKVKPLNPLSKEELAELARLPRGWKWVKIGDVSNCLDSQRVPVNKSDRIKRTGNIPYYGANGQVGWIDDYLFDEPLVLVVEDETFTGREKPFSYLITGKSWVNNHAHILQPTSGLDLDFLNYQLSYYPFTPLTTGTTGRKKLTQFALTNAPFKICSLPEQQAIVQEIETRLSVCDKIEQDIETNLEKAEALRQSILKKAFEGKLLNEKELAEVRGAEDWEPAEVLLERIKKERAGNGKK